ncbi:MAG: PAS domain S-box protein, partial [Dehalococcoidia bacterium]|nr:PAS domain S-box protein [Dehalococcoidia bacterium]
AWCAAVLAVVGARYLVYRAYWPTEPPPERAHAWARRFVLGTGATGVLWGFLGSALYPASSIPHQFLVIFLVGGMVLSALVVLAPVRQAFLAFMLPALALLTATVFAQGTELHFFMGVLIVVFLGVMLATGPVISEMMGEAVRMRFENSALVAQLSEANRELSERIAGQKRSEEVLRQSTQRFEALIEASPLAIILRDAEGRVEKWNAAAERLFGWCEQELLGRPAPLRAPGGEAEGEGYRERVLRGESFSDLETVWARRDGTPLHVSISAAPVRDARGVPVSYLTIVTDLSERRRAEQRRDLENAVALLLAEAQSTEQAMPRVIRTLCESLGYVYGARWVVEGRERALRCAESWCVPDPAIEEFRAISSARVEIPGMPGGLNRRVWATSAPCWLADIAAEPTLRRRELALEAGLQNAFAFPILVGGEFYGVMEFFGRGVRPRDERVIEVSQSVALQIGQYIARKQAETNLQFFASHDPLTNLFNRSMFNQRLQQAIAQAERLLQKCGVQTLCVHGDTPEAVALIRQVRAELLRQGYLIRSFIHSDSSGLKRRCLSGPA